MSVLSKERLTEKTKDCFGYRLKDGSDAEVGFFKNYDAFYSHMMTVKALGEYEDLEEQGLLLRLPCKVGDTVWFIVEAYSFGEVGDKAEEWYSIHTNKFNLNMLDDFGKTVFLTQSEAEEKLRELEGK